MYLRQCECVMGGSTHVFCLFIQPQLVNSLLSGPQHLSLTCSESILAPIPSSPAALLGSFSAQTSAAVFCQATDQSQCVRLQPFSSTPHPIHHRVVTFVTSDIHLGPDHCSHSSHSPPRAMPASSLAGLLPTDFAATLLNPTKVSSSPWRQNHSS